MKASDGCIALIKRFESFRASPYLCPAGVPTIGFGSTRYADGTPIKLTDSAITEQQAEGILAVAIREYEAAVMRYAQYPLKQCQFDALVSFAYNCGTQNLRTSTLLKYVNMGNITAAADEFNKWVNSNGKRLSGLVKRRAAERALFLS